jgi:hypothetical protein
MERAVQQALAREGIGDEVLAAGRFNPRGHTGESGSRIELEGSRVPVTHSKGVIAALSDG